MISSLRRFLLLMGAVLAAPLFAAAAEPAILAKARARLGSETALDGIKTLRYEGTLTTTDPKDPTKTIVAKVEMTFLKPDRQRIVANYEKFTETTALDSYEGWTRVQDSTDPTKWRLTLLDGNQIKRLRANTWQSLAYYRGIDRVGGTIEDQGTALKEGVNCQKIAFIHGPNIVFYRFFEVGTGRLVITETESGATLREEGDIMASGIRFPKTLVTVTKANDKVPSQTITLTYDKITVNEPVDASAFAMPSLGR